MLTKRLSNKRYKNKTVIKYDIFVLIYKFKSKKIKLYIL